MTSKLTTERLEKIKSWRETYGAGSNVMLLAEEAEELARIALTAMDSEPVAFINGAWTLVYYRPPKESGLKIGDKLYRHAQQPVVLDEISMSSLLPIMSDQLEAAGYVKGWNACRAAMLQGGNSPAHFRCRPAQSSLSPAQGGNSPAIPGAWIPVSERMPIDFEAVIAFDGDQVYGEAMYSSDDGFTIDGYEPCDRLKLQNVTHWMPLPPPPKEVK